MSLWLDSHKRLKTTRISVFLLILLYFGKMNFNVHSQVYWYFYFFFFKNKIPIHTNSVFVNISVQTKTQKWFENAHMSTPAQGHYAITVVLNASRLITLKAYWSNPAWSYATMQSEETGTRLKFKLLEWLFQRDGDWCWCWCW